MMKEARTIIEKMFGNMFADYGKELGRETAVCEKHGEYESIIKVGMNGEPWKSGCPKCLEEQEAENEARRQKAEEVKKQEEEKRQREQKIWEFRRAGIEPLYDNATFESFITETPEQKHNLQRVRELTEGKIDKIIMLGPNGTGKTHLACAAVQIMGGKIITMYEISAMIRASYSNGGAEIDIVEQLSSYPLLVIDEMGRTKGSETEANWLSFIIDKRHSRRLPLILISNKHARKQCDKGGCPNCLENYIGEDIMSRLSDNGVMLRFSGDDWRRKAKPPAIL